MFDASVAPPPSNSPQDMRYMGDQDGRLISPLAPPSPQPFSTHESFIHLAACEGGGAAGR